MKRKQLLTIISIIVIVAVVWGLNYFKTENVRAAEVYKGEIREYIELRGKVELDKTEKVYSNYTGVIRDLKVDEGDMVAAGMALVQFEAPDRQVAGVELERAQIAINTTRREYKYLQEKYQKYKQLFQTGAISEQDMKDMELQYNNAENAWREAEQQYKIIAYNSFQNSKDANRSIIAAKTSGTVISKFVDKGAVVEPGTPLYEIGDYNSAYIRVDVLVDDMYKVKADQPAVISGDILDNREVTGVVYYIAPKGVTSVSSLGVEQQRVEVRIRYDNSEIKLRPGYDLDVNLITDQKAEALYVPDKAVFEMDGHDSVFVIKDGKLELREIKKGIENNDFIEVTSGLNAGEKVVIDPANNLKPDIRVRGSAD